MRPLRMALGDAQQHGRLHAAAAEASPVNDPASEPSTRWAWICMGVIALPGVVAVVALVMRWC
jgi:hypothetical protein